MAGKHQSTGKCDRTCGRMSEKRLIRARDLPQSDTNPTERADFGLDASTLAGMERADILSVREANDRHRSRAARALGISPTTLRRKLKSRDG